MKADPRGIVLALRRAVKEGNRGLVEFLTDTIVEALERLDAIDAKAEAERTHQESEHGNRVVAPVRTEAHD